MLQLRSGVRAAPLRFQVARISHRRHCDCPHTHTTHICHCRSPPTTIEMNAPDGVLGGDVLPVDKHRQRIIDHIRHHRVTMGETGCGKSTRIPEMIFESEHKAGRECRMFVSQPRSRSILFFNFALYSLLALKSFQNSFSPFDLSHFSRFRFVFSNGFLILL
jgi:hypothetical protein